LDRKPPEIGRFFYALSGAYIRPVWGFCGGAVQEYHEGFKTPVRAFWGPCGALSAGYHIPAKRAGSGAGNWQKLVFLKPEKIVFVFRVIFAPGVFVGAGTRGSLKVVKVVKVAKVVKVVKPPESLGGF
jgi:hypothetical protein